MTIIQPCLLCDAPVEVEHEEWTSGEAPIALCDDCYRYVNTGLLSWPMVKMIYMMRCQIGDLYKKNEELERRVGALLGAQKELEQELLKVPKAA